MADVGTAGLELLRSGFVARRGTADRGSNIAIREHESVIPISRFSLIRETESMQRFIEPIPTAVSREHSAGSIASMGRWGKPQDIQTRARISKSGNWTSPIGPVTKLFPFRLGDRLSIGDQPGTGPTIRDVIVQYGQVTHGGRSLA